MSLSDASVSAAKALCATIMGNGERTKEFVLTNSVLLSLSFQMEPTDRRTLLSQLNTILSVEIMLFMKMVINSSGL